MNLKTGQIGKIYLKKKKKMKTGQQKLPKLKGKEKQKWGKKIQELWDNYKKTCNISASKTIKH